MRATFLKDTYIRSNPNDLTAPPLGVVFEGTVIEVNDQTVSGADQNGNSAYFQDKKGWYYWSGQATVSRLNGEQAVSRNIHVVGLSISSTPEAEDSAKKTYYDEALSARESEDGATAINPGFATDEDDSPKVDSRRDTGPDSTRNGQVSDSFDLRELYTVDEFSLELVGGHFDSELTLAKEEEIQELLENSTYCLDWWHKFLKIDSFFWKEKQLTGEGVNIVMICQDFDPDHPDLFNQPIDFKSFGPAQKSEDDFYNLGTLYANLILGGGKMQFLGIAPNAKLSVAKIASDETAQLLRSFQSAADWAIRKNADILLISYAWNHVLFDEDTIQQTKSIMDRLYHHNVLLISPVGDQSFGITESQFLNRYESMLTIGAHDHNCRKHVETLKSPNLDMLAPAPIPIPTGMELANTFECPVTGQAAAVAAACLALTKEFMQAHNITMTNHRFMQMVRYNTQSLNGSRFFKDLETGYGVFDAERVLESLAQLPEVNYQLQLG